MSGLVGPNGKPISSKTLNKKARPPVIGEKMGSWAGEEVRMFYLPGGGAIQFDLSQLTLADYRQMRDHYQINSSLTLLTFLLHQMEWHIECEDSKIADSCQENMEEVWTRLVRSMSQAFWAGFSPNVLQWENDVQNRKVVLDKIKDLVPEECYVNWKEVEGYRPPGGHSRPKLKVFDGIRQVYWPYPFPVDNSFWYPLLMENANYYGRKLLRPAFVPWFFSLLLHLFANRYYERFGEPTPVGRAPYDEEISSADGNSTMRGNEMMRQLLEQLRSRATVVLPNEKTQFGDETQLDYDYQIEYLESQMRGADFDKYMTRLDEEMSIGLFTPILMMRTADVGSYNLGVGHMKVWLWMLNAIAGDWKTYIDKYILAPLANFNFSLNSPRPKIKFRRLGNEDSELVREVVKLLVGQQKIEPDMRQLAEASGIEWKKARVLTEPATEPGKETGPGNPTPGSPDEDTGEDVKAVVDKIYKRTYSQVRNALANGGLEGVHPNFGYQRQFEDTLVSHGYEDAESRTRAFYNQLDSFFSDLANLGDSEFAHAEHFMKTFRAGANAAIAGVLS